MNSSPEIDHTIRIRTINEETYSKINEKHQISLDFLLFNANGWQREKSHISFHSRQSHSRKLTRTKTEIAAQDIELESEREKTLRKT